MDIKVRSENLENKLKQIIARTDFLDCQRDLEARTASGLKLLKQDKRLIP